MAIEKIIILIIVLIGCLVMGWRIYKNVTKAQKELAEIRKQLIKEKEGLAKIKETMGFSETKKETIRSIEELEKVMQKKGLI